jgi:hypothetical protein
MAYQEAKARTRTKSLDGAIIVPAEKDGFYLYTTTLHRGMSVPFGRVWYATEAEAKQHCLETMKIEASDWVVREGDPPLMDRITNAIAETMKRYNQFVKDSDESSGR